MSEIRDAKGASLADCYYLDEILERADHTREEQGKHLSECKHSDCQRVKKNWAGHEKLAKFITP